MQYHCSFSGAPKISRKSDFHTFTLCQAWQNKINKTRIRALYIFSSLYTGCSTKQAISLFLLQRVQSFKKKWFLRKYFGWMVVNEKRKTRIKRLCILKMLCAGCSTKKQYHCFFRGAPGISRKINFHTYTLGQLWQI